MKVAPKLSSKYIKSFFSAVVASTVAGIPSALAVPVGYDVNNVADASDLKEEISGGKTYLNSDANNIIRFGTVGGSTVSGGATPDTDSVKSVFQASAGSTSDIDFIFNSDFAISNLTQTTTTNAGAEVNDTNGSVNLVAGTSQANVLTGLVRVQRTSVYNATTNNPANIGANAGEDATLWGYMNAGTFVDLSNNGAGGTLDAGTLAALDTFVGTPNAANAAAVLASLGGGELTALTNASLYTVGATSTTAGQGALTVAGQTTLNGGLDNGGNTITNVADGVAATDAATVGQLSAGDASLTTRISTEESTRGSADTSLTSRVSTEEDARASADTSLTTRVSTEEDVRASADTSLTSRVSTEESTRASADTSLTTRVSTEESTRASADTSLTTRVSTEESVRASADTSLTTRVSTEEVARASGDTSLTSRVSTEEVTRATADTSLSTRISTESSSRISGDASLATALSTEVSVRTGLIREVAAGATGSTQGSYNEIHIGNNSLVTYEDTALDQQVITTDLDGILVNKTLTVAENITSTTVTNTAAGSGDPIPTIASTGNPTTRYVVTQLGSTDVATESNASGGVVMETNGNVTLRGATTSTSTVSYVRVARYQTVVAGNAGEGTPVAGTQEFLGGYIDEDGNFVSLGTLNGQGLLDLSTLTDEQLALITTEEEEVGAGGNLDVGGNAVVAGTIHMGGLLVATVNDVAAEASTRAAADTSLSTRITSESSTRAAADVSLTTRISTEESVRAAAVTSLNARVDGVVTRLNRAESQIQENRRGIAMVAAMTSPTVQPGKNNALDVNASVFDGKVGMAVAYARRINENVQVNAAVATTSDLEEAVGRAGVSIQW